MKINCLVYRPTKLEKLLSKIIPYYIPFLTKRKRVKIRKYWRNRYKNRLMSDLNNALQEAYKEQLNLPLTLPSIDETDWEWEILPKSSNRDVSESFHSHEDNSWHEQEKINKVF